MSTVEAPQKAPGKPETSLSIVDCDVHPYHVNGMDDLAPYLSEVWRQRLGIGERPEWAKYINGGSVGMPKNEFYTVTSGPLRNDAIPPQGGVPGSDPAFVAEQLLDEYDIDRAILLGGPNSGHGAFPNVESLNAICAAYNDWVIERWCGADERYRAAILVAPQDAELAVKEIERVADRPGVAAIHMPVSRVAPGERQFWPIYEVAQHHGLPIVVHPGATEAIYTQAPSLGYVPTYYLEWHTCITQPAQSAVASLICHGVFEKFPKLRYVFAECGFAWLADVMWRLERDWKAQREEVPWVKQNPTDYLVSNLRFTSQPFYETGKPEHIEAVLEMMHAERTLLFSSDYPHWDFDDPRRALKDLPEEIRDRVYFENAVETFGDRLN